MADIPRKLRGRDLVSKGTVVRVGDEPGAIAFVSCLDFESHREMLKPLRQLLYRSANTQETVQQLKSVLTREGESCHTGILFCEKVINIPPMLLPKLYDAIFDEIAWAQEDEPTKELRDSFRFDNLCLITDVLMSSAGTSSNLKRRQKHKKKKRKTKSAGEAAPEAKMEFFRPDDEAVWKHTSFWVSFALPGHAPIKGGLIRRRVALFFPAAATPEIRADCEKLVSGTQG